tara:strand:- start:1049 stop:1756 length:708 start_codon:yes stop_codon:yes gene_type:complete
MKKIKIKIFADGANIDEIINLNKISFIKGFTTNPSLMKKSGIKDYKNFAKAVLTEVKNKPISFEVIADKISEMERQAYEIATWGKNINVKIPMINSKGKYTDRLVAKLLKDGISCNVTAIFKISDINRVLRHGIRKTPLILSVFAGRIADTGQDPAKLIKDSVKCSKKYKNVEILWASTREVLNIFQAENYGCHIITVPNNILTKLKFLGYSTSNLQIDTVKQFYKDAISSKFKI